MPSGISKGLDAFPMLFGKPKEPIKDLFKNYKILKGHWEYYTKEMIVTTNVNEASFQKWIKND